MEKIEITLTLDGEKQYALDFYLKKENTTVQHRMDEALKQLYETTVPQDVREYLDAKTAPPSPSVRPAPPRRNHKLRLPRQVPRKPRRKERNTMVSREITLWLDERWYRALSHQLGEDAVEARLNQCLDQLIQQLPQDQREKISGEIQKEGQRWQEELEAMRYFSVFRVKEHGKEERFQLENTPYSLLNVANSLRHYLRQESGSEVGSYTGRFPDRESIIAEKFDQMTGLLMENSQKVTGVFDLDFDKRELSSVDPQDGWVTYTMKDLSTAAYHAFRSGNASLEQRWERLMDNLRGKEITSAGHLSLREISFAEEICEMNGRRLNFYLEASFDVDAVFGTHVCTAENDDSLNVYADYDMATGRVCDELEVDLHRADGREESVEYRLNAAEKAVLLRKMDEYCQQQTGQSLKDYSAALMAEEEIVPPAGPTL